jgi:hypothetical protein
MSKINRVLLWLEEQKEDSTSFMDFFLCVREKLSVDSAWRFYYNDCNH